MTVLRQSFVTPRLRAGLTARWRSTQLLTCSRSLRPILAVPCQNKADFWTQPNSNRAVVHEISFGQRPIDLTPHKAYSTSQPPDKDSRSISKRPLLKALTKLTPHENIYTIPNILTASRLIAAPIVGYLVLHDQHAWAVGLFAYAGITDLVDGWIARRWNLQTVVGTVIDPMADKTLMTILTVCLAIKGALPVWLAGIILGRDVGLAIAAIYYRWISLPPPKTFARYWDFSLPSAEVHPTTISKYNTALQLALIGATTAMPLVTVDVTTAMTAMQYLVATTTIWSGASYVYTKDAVKILNQTQDQNKSGEKDKEEPLK
ncbi:phosphatidyl synthase [Phlyctema vagabunda]|uniref:Phosphatidyl synthase n=1 Tax=Phlyctema vagabunda TaxID=108571 RepID=A0ABR4PQX1_9HELO